MGIYSRFSPTRHLIYTPHPFFLFSLSFSSFFFPILPSSIDFNYSSACCPSTDGRGPRVSLIDDAFRHLRGSIKFKSWHSRTRDERILVCTDSCRVITRWIFCSSFFLRERNEVTIPPFVQEKLKERKKKKKTEKGKKTRRTTFGAVFHCRHAHRARTMIFCHA